MKLARKPLFGMIALGAALAMPVAFAQEADATAQEPTTTTQDPTAAPQAEPATAGQQLTWADLDVDGNGTLSKQEASNVNSLAQVFDEADAGANTPPLIVLEAGSITTLNILYTQNMAAKASVNDWNKGTEHTFQ